MKIRVGVVDDHQLFRELLVSHLQDYERIDPHVAQAANGRALLELLKEQILDVVLLDLSMPVMGGEETADIMLRRYPDCKIIILSMEDSPIRILDLMQMGVHGYLQKDCGIDEVFSAITAVVDHDFFQNEVTKRALRYSVNVASCNASTIDLELLTARETQILLKICSELTTKEIGNQLSISQKTVENHRMSLLKKLGVRNTVGLVKYAYERGLLMPHRS
jgi:DNA-binding NarL/FixJ family response regulator